MFSKSTSASYKLLLYVLLSLLARNSFAQSYDQEWSKFILKYTPDERQVFSSLITQKFIDPECVLYQSSDECGISRFAFEIPTDQVFYDDSQYDHYMLKDKALMKKTWVTHLDLDLYNVGSFNSYYETEQCGLVVYVDEDLRDSRYEYGDAIIEEIDLKAFIDNYYPRQSVSIFNNNKCISNKFVAYLQDLLKLNHASVVQLIQEKRQVERKADLLAKVFRYEIIGNSIRYRLDAPVLKRKKAQSDKTTISIDITTPEKQNGLDFWDDSGAKIRIPSRSKSKLFIDIGDQTYELTASSLMDALELPYDRVPTILQDRTSPIRIKFDMTELFNYILSVNKNSLEQLELEQRKKRNEAYNNSISSTPQYPAYTKMSNGKDLNDSKEKSGSSMWKDLFKIGAAVLLHEGARYFTEKDDKDKTQFERHKDIYDEGKTYLDAYNSASDRVQKYRKKYTASSWLKSNALSSSSKRTHFKEITCSCSTTQDYYLFKSKDDSTIRYWVGLSENKRLTEYDPEFATLEYNQDYLTEVCEKKCK